MFPSITATLPPSTRPPRSGSRARPPARPRPPCRRPPRPSRASPPPRRASPRTPLIRPRPMPPGPRSFSASRWRNIPSSAATRSARSARATESAPAQIAEANDILVTDFLFVGQVLQIPTPNLNDVGPALKLVPDSDFVYGPSSVGFNLEAFVGCLRRLSGELHRGHPRRAARRLRRSPHADRQPNRTVGGRTLFAQPAPAAGGARAPERLGG